MDNDPDETSSEEKAQQRTDWAEDRTILANERTFNSWMGTGMGAVALAVGLQAVFGKFEPVWAAKTVASVFLLIAIFLFWTARRQAQKTLTRLTDNDAEAQPGKNFTLLATCMTAGTLAVGAILWSL